MTKLSNMNVVLQAAFAPHQPARHPVDHDPLGQVHGVGDGQHHQAGVALRWPIEQVVHDILLPGPEQVQLQQTRTESDSVDVTAEDLVNGAPRYINPAALPVCSFTGKAAWQKSATQPNSRGRR